MTAYLAGVCSSALSFIFIVFAIGAIGYLVGGIKIKGIELGTAGVLLVARLSLSGKTQSLFSAIKSKVIFLLYLTSERLFL